MTFQNWQKKVLNLSNWLVNSKVKCQIICIIGKQVEQLIVVLHNPYRGDHRRQVRSIYCALIHRVRDPGIELLSININTDLLWWPSFWWLRKPWPLSLPPHLDPLRAPSADPLLYQLGKKKRLLKKMDIRISVLNLFEKSWKCRDGEWSPSIQLFPFTKIVRLHHSVYCAYLLKILDPPPHTVVQCQ